MIEGVAHTANEFIAAHPGYYRLADAADRAADQFSVTEADEVIIDDKVAGYRLSDYLAWSGHRREYDRQGDETHTETSRLYLPGKMQGADRVRAGGALAFPSRRKIDLDPLLYFAAAGFPREESWRRRWQTAQGSDVKLDDFERADAGQRFEEAVFVRQAHSLVLFGLIAADEDPGRQARRAELTALKDQQWLAGVAEDLIAEIERRKQIDALENALKTQPPPRSPSSTQRSRKG
ncbi:hypothetical protein NKH89_12735 [Mesorhizobium sp. M0923]|uniref:hypothetical protein n=1 Tax=unclassified Mesorhizobium TaxID=325217 RepID=UPI0003D01518|nr:hypothetical protein [Mesorhizobium sp. L48C026A00]ESZ08513.1 hypothetical protein X737_33705 [Mesorhizobium sp. L48C026A00]